MYVELPGQQPDSTVEKEEDWAGDMSVGSFAAKRKSYGSRGGPAKRARGGARGGTSQYFKSRFKGKKKRFVVCVHQKISGHSFGKV